MHCEQRLYFQVIEGQGRVPVRSDVPSDPLGPRVRTGLSGLRPRNPETLASIPGTLGPERPGLSAGWSPRCLRWAPGGKRCALTRL